MTTLSRKQREVQDREKRILDVARRMLLEKGYIGLGMDRIAAEIEYSKGTVYQHFTCKEDLVAALAVRTMYVKRTLFERAAETPGRPRERMTAIGVADELFASVYPLHARTLQLLTEASVWDKASADRRNEMLCHDQTCATAVLDITRTGVSSGDLVLPPGVPVEQVVFGLWSMAWGARAIMASGLASDAILEIDAERALKNNFQHLLDGYGWRPLSTEWDYAAVAERARDRILATNLPSDD